MRTVSRVNRDPSIAGDAMEALDVIWLLKASQDLERSVTVALMYAGLRVPQYRLLTVLAQSEQVTVTDISKALKITRATASVMVNDLIKMHIVATLDNPQDRRSFYLRLTERGQNKLHVARKDLAVMTTQLESRCPPEMIKALNEFSRMKTP